MASSMITTGIEQLQKGNFVIFIDDRQRENEGDLVLAAGKATAEKLNFMIKEARGIMCIAMTGERLEELKIPLMVQDSTDRFGTPFTVSVDAKQNTTTGVSVHDRLQTVKTLIDPSSKPEHLARPGHLFPLRAAENGLKGRQGHTEAAVELCTRAGLYPAALIVEILNEDGQSASLGELEAFGARHHIPVVPIQALLRE
ncbi:3,4-dihydroxy-2-butanone-4-phosphate synthase [Candidatus Woesearchaeota archaeon]|nr:3,4-dihydroxy-2-butanone-4-phosphate synthase [Candidatus Woesearchaeota archaeon]